MTLTDTLFSFNGRLNRMAYFGYSVLNFFVVAFGIFASAECFNSVDATPLGFIIGLAAIVYAVWAGYAVAAKRLHDLGYSANYLWGIAFVGFATSAFTSTAPALSTLFGLIQLAIALCLLFYPGQAGDNQYGPDPLK